MTIRRTLAAAFLLSILAIGYSIRAQAPTPPRAGTLTEGVTAVLVDVVVRDRRGQPVRDLQESDFEVFEDGVPQAIGSFTPIAHGEVARQQKAPEPSIAARVNPATVVAPPVTPGPPVTAIVIHGLTPDSRRRANAAARPYTGCRTS